MRSRSGSADHRREAHEDRRLFATSPTRTHACTRSRPSCIRSSRGGPILGHVRSVPEFARWSKWVIFSRRMKSSSSVCPSRPAFSELWLSATFYALVRRQRTTGRVNRTRSSGPTVGLRPTFGPPLQPCGRVFISLTVLAPAIGLRLDGRGPLAVPVPHRGQTPRLCWVVGKCRGDRLRRAAFSAAVSPATGHRVARDAHCSHGCSVRCSWSCHFWVERLGHRDRRYAGEECGRPCCAAEASGFMKPRCTRRLCRETSGTWRARLQGRRCVMMSDGSMSPVSMRSSGACEKQ